MLEVVCVCVVYGCVCIPMSVHSCMYICIHAYMHSCMYIWVDIHVCTYVQRSRGLYQVSLSLIFWHRASLFLLVWLVWESQRSSCLTLPSTRILAVYLNSVPLACVGSVYCLFQSNVHRHHLRLLITLAGNLVLTLESQGEDLRRSIQTSRKRCVAGPSKENIS